MTTDTDEGPCTTCGDTGITIQTEKPCTCAAGISFEAPPTDTDSMSRGEAKRRFHVEGQTSTIGPRWQIWDQQHRFARFRNIASMEDAHNICDELNRLSPIPQSEAADTVAQTAGDDGALLRIALRIIEDVSHIENPSKLSPRTVTNIVFDARKALGAKWNEPVENVRARLTRPNDTLAIKAQARREALEAENWRLRKALADIANGINVEGSALHEAQLALDKVVSSVKTHARHALSQEPQS